MRGVNFHEKRQYPREVVQLPGTGEIMSRGPGGEGKRLHESRTGLNRFSVSVADVSAGGLQMHFNADLVGGDVVRLSFGGPETAGPLIIEGHLVWVRRNPIDIFGRFSAGVRFRRTDESLPAKFHSIAHPANA